MNENPRSGVNPPRPAAHTVATPYGGAHRQGRHRDREQTRRHATRTSHRHGDRRTHQPPWPHRPPPWPHRQHRRDPASACYGRHQRPATGPPGRPFLRYRQPPAAGQTSARAPIPHPGPVCPDHAPACAPAPLRAAHPCTRPGPHTPPRPHSGLRFDRAARRDVMCWNSARE